MQTAFTDLVGARYPIVGVNRSPGVVAAVTNAGGFGVLAASAFRPEELRPAADCGQRIADLGRLLTTGSTITGVLS
jgi:NAD(P)H-dependent flavin oxidoreductase YrpB (nitropropane dioxygenase family)